MRKIIICEEITPAIQQIALDSGIGELVVGIPTRYMETVTPDQLPLILVESASFPDVVLLASSIKTTASVRNAQIEIDRLVDFPTPLPSIAISLRVNTIESTIQDILSRLQNLENVP